MPKLSRRPLPKEVGDALFAYEGFLHGLGDMSPNASHLLSLPEKESMCVYKKKVNNKNRKS